MCILHSAFSIRLWSRQVPVVDSSVSSTEDAIDDPIIIDSVPSDNLVSEVTEAETDDDRGIYHTPMERRDDFIPNSGMDFVTPIGTPTDEAGCIEAIFACDEQLESPEPAWVSYFNCYQAALQSDPCVSQESVVETLVD